MGILNAIDKGIIAGRVECPDSVCIKDIVNRTESACIREFAERHNKLIKFLDEAKKKHQNNIDRENVWFACPVVEAHSFGVAPKGEWCGTEKERIQAIKENEENRKYTRCEFCDLIDKIKKDLKELEAEV